MKLKTCAILLIAALFSVTHLQGGVFEDWLNYFWKEEPKPPTIKILLVHDQPGVVLEVKNGKYKIIDPKNESLITTRFTGKRKYVQAVNDGLKWGEGFPGIHQIVIVPDDPSTTTLVDGIEYKGSIYVYDIGGTISVVNKIDLEDYLKATLASQFENDAPEEELSAIAITARTNATFQANNPKNTFWDVEANKVGYDGFTPAASLGYAIKKAVDKSRYMVLEKDGALFPAVWGTATGGKMNREKADFSHITLFEAEEMAKKGDDASKILAKAFPGTVLKLNFTP